MSKFLLIIDCIFILGNRHHNRPVMADAFNYTTIFAPLGFFIGGILLVLLLNRFIGKTQSKKSD